MKKQFLQDMHNFRTLAIVGIVAAHCVPHFNWAEGSQIPDVLNAIANESSIWFFFIAGYLFRHLSKNFSYGDYLFKKLKFIILPYLIVSIPALIASTTIIEQDVPAGFYSKPIVEQILLFLISGKHLAPFWFVPTISLIYLLGGILFRLDKTKYWYWSLLLLIPFSFWMGREGVQTALNLGAFGSTPSKAAYLLSAYVFGMFCSRYRSELLDLAQRWWKPWLAVVLILFVVTVINISKSPPTWIFAWKMLAAPIIIYALTKPSTAFLGRAGYLGETSFGVFFVHGYFISGSMLLLSRLFGIEALPASLPVFAACVGLVTALSLLTIWLAQKILGKRSRYVIGC